jgi:predicted DCC family thiol-disulfide oxidoreductase YuxK
VLQGTAALEKLFSTVGLGWAVNLMELPIISKLVDLLYEFLSANRISLGNALVSEAGCRKSAKAAHPGSS